MKFKFSCSFLVSQVWPWKFLDMNAFFETAVWQQILIGFYIFRRWNCYQKSMLFCCGTRYFCFLNILQITQTTAVFIATPDKLWHLPNTFFRRCARRPQQIDGHADWWTYRWRCHRTFFFFLTSKLAFIYWFFCWQKEKISHTLPKKSLQKSQVELANMDDVTRILARKKSSSVNKHHGWEFAFKPGRNVMMDALTRVVASTMWSNISISYLDNHNIYYDMFIKIFVNNSLSPFWKGKNSVNTFIINILTK